MPAVRHVPATVTLLTSMMSYYACGRCVARWSVARNWLAFPGPERSDGSRSRCWYRGISWRSCVGTATRKYPNDVMHHASTVEFQRRKYAGAGYVWNIAVWRMVTQTSE